MRRVVEDGNGNRLIWKGKQKKGSANAVKKMRMGKQQKRAEKERKIKNTIDNLLEIRAKYDIMIPV